MITENLVDLNYDLNDAVSVKTAQQGFFFLRLAVSETMAMIEDLVAVMAYTGKLRNTGETCSDLVTNYIEPVTRYNDLLDYLSNTFNMVWPLRINALNADVKVTHFGPYKFKDTYF